LSFENEDREVIFSIRYDGEHVVAQGRSKTWPAANLDRAIATIGRDGGKSDVASIVPRLLMPSLEGSFLSESAELRYVGAATVDNKRCWVVEAVEDYGASPPKSVLLLSVDKISHTLRRAVLRRRVDDVLNSTRSSETQSSISYYEVSGPTP
jgi:hypothetical protein